MLSELPPPPCCDKLVRKDLKVKPEFVGHKIRRRPHPLLKSRLMRSGDRYKSVSTPACSWGTRMGTIPNIAAPVFWWLSLGLQPNGWWRTMEMNKKTLKHSESITNTVSTLERIASCRYKNKMDKRSGFWQVDLTPNA